MFKSFIDFKARIILTQKFIKFGKNYQKEQIFPHKVYFNGFQLYNLNIPVEPIKGEGDCKVPKFFYKNKFLELHNTYIDALERLGLDH